MFENIRLVRTTIMEQYAANTKLFERVGNWRFAEMLSKGLLRAPESCQTGEWLVFHAWKRNRVRIDNAASIRVRQLLQGRPVASEDRQTVEWLEENGLLACDPAIQLDEIIERTSDTFLAIQNRYELRQFVEHVYEIRPRVIVEIGTARGGVLYSLSQVASRDATLISIDLPGAPNGGGQTEEERELFASFGPHSQRFHFVPSNSQWWTTRRDVIAALMGEKIDLLFIDGDHSYGGCMSDFNLYGPLVDVNGWIVFHDICVFPEVWGPGNEVGVVWRELKGKYGGIEILDPNGVCAPIPPAGMTRSWGIGVIEARRLRG